MPCITPWPRVPCSWAWGSAGPWRAGLGAGGARPARPSPGGGPIHQRRAGQALPQNRPGRARRHLGDPAAGAARPGGAGDGAAHGAAAGSAGNPETGRRSGRAGRTWRGLLLAGIAAPLWMSSPGAVARLADPSASGAALWPVALAAMLALVARRVGWRVPVVPPGDMLVPLERLWSRHWPPMQAWRRHAPGAAGTGQGGWQRRLHRRSNALSAGDRDTPLFSKRAEPVGRNRFPCVCRSGAVGCRAEWLVRGATRRVVSAADHASLA